MQWSKQKISAISPPFRSVFPFISHGPPPLVLPSSLVFRTRPFPPLPLKLHACQKVVTKKFGFYWKKFCHDVSRSLLLWWSIIPRVKEEQGGANWKITGSRPTYLPTYKVPYAAKSEGLSKLDCFCGKRPHVSENSKSIALGFVLLFCKAKRRNTKGRKKVQMRKSFSLPRSPRGSVGYDDFAASDFCFRIYLLRLLFKKRNMQPPDLPTHTFLLFIFKRASFFPIRDSGACVCCTHASHSPTRVKVNNPSIFLDEKPSVFFETPNCINGGSVLLPPCFTHSL